MGATHAGAMIHAGRTGMRTASILVNVALSLFTLFVLVTDGMPGEVRFIALSLLVLFLPAITALAIQRSRGASANWGLIACNVVLLAAVTWAVATQYASHPKETGLLAYTILLFAAPVLSLAVLMRGTRRAGEALT